MALKSFTINRLNFIVMLEMKSDIIHHNQKNNSSIINDYSGPIIKCFMLILGIVIDTLNQNYDKRYLYLVSLP